VGTGSSGSSDPSGFALHPGASPQTRNKNRGHVRILMDESIVSVNSQIRERERAEAVARWCAHQQPDGACMICRVDQTRWHTGCNRSASRNQRMKPCLVWCIGWPRALLLRLTAGDEQHLWT